MKAYLKILLTGVSLLTSSLTIAESYPQQPRTYPSSKNIHWIQNFDEAVAASRSSSKPILILFTGIRWCGPCRTLEKDILTQPEFIDAVSSKFIFLKAELHDPTEAGMAKSPYKPLFDRYEVKFFPTMEIVNADGSRLFTLPYQPGNAAGYAQVLLAKLKQAQKDGDSAS